MAKVITLRVKLSIEDKVKLNFDPSKTKEDQIAKIFADETARTLWLTWRPYHIVNQYFGREVIERARKIKKEKPTTVFALSRCLRSSHFSSGRSNFIEADIDKWCPIALPFFTGEKVVSYEVLQNAPGSA